MRVIYKYRANFNDTDNWNVRQRLHRFATWMMDNNDNDCINDNIGQLSNKLQNSIKISMK